MSRWILGWTVKIHRYIWPICPLNFTGGQKMQQFGTIVDPVAFAFIVVLNCSNLSKFYNKLVRQWWLPCVFPICCVVWLNLLCESLRELAKNRRDVDKGQKYHGQINTKFKKVMSQEAVSGSAALFIYCYV